MSKGRPRFNRNTGRVYTPKNTKDYQNLISSEVLKSLYNYPPYQGPIVLELEFGFSVKRPKYVWPNADIDNLSKAVMDSLNDSGRIWVDDAQVVALHAKKKFSPVNYILIKVYADECLE